jgi:hypothetical protein
MLMALFNKVRSVYRTGFPHSRFNLNLVISPILRKVCYVSIFLATSGKEYRSCYCVSEPFDGPFFHFRWTFDNFIKLWMSS